MSDDVPALTVENLSQQMKDLVDWESFGISLPGVSYTDIQIIKADHSKTQVQKMELFDTWIKAYPQATWKDVTQALEKNDEYGLAQNINLYQQHEIIKMACDIPHIKQPTANALCCTLRGLSHWEEFAVHLPGISQEIIDEVKYCHGNEDQNGRLFSKWLELFPSASWEDVLKAIDETMKQVREKIQAEHLLKDTLKKVILPYVIYKPTVPALTESLKGLKNWEEFGQYLPKLELSHIKSISSSKHDDPIDLEKQLYSVWLTVHPTALWREVVLALEKSDNATLANTLRKILPFDVLHFNVTPLEIEIGKETVTELRLLYDEYHTLSHNFEEAIVSACSKLSSVTRWVKRMPPYKLEGRLASVDSFEEFFDVIAIHHNFLNCYLLLSLAKQFLNGSPYVAKLTYHSSDVQKFMESQKIQSLQTSLVPFVQKGPLQAPITIKLHHCYEEEDTWVVEKLLEKLFGLEHSKLCQIFRITPGSVLVTLLTPQYAVKELGSISKRKDSFMKFVGILALQIKTNYVFIHATVEANKYTFEKGLIAALEAYEYEAVEFLLNETHQVNVNARAESDQLFERMKNLQSGIGRTPQLDDAEEDNQNNIGMAEANDDNANVHSLPLPDLLPGDENSNLVFPRESGATPLMIACYNNDTDVIQLLLEKGADPNLQTETGWTALIYAAVVGSGHAIALLLKYKAEIDKKKESNGITALHYGCQMGNGRAVDVLLEHSADPNTKMKDGVTPLYGACESGRLEIVRKLLKKGAKADIQKDADGATPLYAASEKGHFEVVDELINANVMPNRPAFDGVTPLYMASQNGHFKVVERLLREKINPNVKLNRDDGTPLIAASWHGHLKIVEILLQAKADPNAVIRDTGSTPIFSASERGYSEVVERLLKEPGIAVDAPFKDGRTALFVACQFGHFKVVQKLLKAHANPNTRMTSDPRLTPLGVATINHYTRIEQILRQYGARY